MSHSRQLPQPTEIRDAGRARSAESSPEPSLREAVTGLVLHVALGPAARLLPAIVWLAALFSAVRAVLRTLYVSLRLLVFAQALGALCVTAIVAAAGLAH